MITPDDIKWIANGFIYIGAITITFFPRFSLKPYLFTLFLAGHIIWCWAGFFLYDPIDMPIIALNGGFIIIDAIAIWKRVGLEEKLGIGNE